MYGYTIFHEKLINTLLNAVSEEKTSHAYIFNADSGMFPEEAASLFAQALTCSSSGIKPCGVCRSCVEARAKTNPDIIYIDTPKDKKTIDVETIRRMTEDCAVTPFNAPRKVYIIKNGDTMTPSAQNAFLKTFEEPPEYAVFIIIVQNIDNLLQTILSRGTLIEFPPLPQSIVRNYIKNKYPDEHERLEYLVNYCEGVPGIADAVIENEDFEKLRSSSLNMLSKLMNKRKLDSFEIEKYINENSQNADMIFDFWISYLRDVMIFECGVFDKCLNIDKASELKKFTEVCSKKQVIGAVDILCEGKEMLARYVKPSAAAMRCALKIKAL